MNYSVFNIKKKTCCNIYEIIYFIYLNEIDCNILMICVLAVDKYASLYAFDYIEIIFFLKH